MKRQSKFKLRICILFLSTQLIAQQRIKLKGVIMENDYHEKISWVKSKPVALVSKDFIVSAMNVKFIQIYFGAQQVEGEQVIMPIRLVNQYQDSDWIFFDEISYLLGSRKEIRRGKGVRFKIKDDDIKRRVDRGVKERSDIKERVC